MKKQFQKAVCSRELSWLKFNIRVLEEAEDETLPLMERFMFLHIYLTNAEEFYRTRVGKLSALSLSDNGTPDVRSGMRPSEQLSAVNGEMHSLHGRLESVCADLERRLAELGHARRKIADGCSDETLAEIFRSKILPALTPCEVGLDDPRPLLAQGSVYAVFALERDVGESVGYVDMGGLPAVIEIDSGEKTEYIMPHELALAFGGELFSGAKIIGRAAMRVTRSAYIDVESAYAEGADTPAEMSGFMDSRESLAAVALRISGGVSPIFQYRLLERFALDDAEIFTTDLLTADLFTEYFYGRMKSERGLYYPAYTPAFPTSLHRGERLIDAAAERDVLISFPYESAEPFLQMLGDCAADPDVTSVKMTLYRLAHPSRIEQALCAAARAGKDVFVCIELRARFSERDNIECAARLSAAGCRVVYGVAGYKVHSKLCRIDKKTADGTLRITQLSTGNYNESTARQYTDIMLVTSDSGIAGSADKVFAALETRALPSVSDDLVTSPDCFRTRIVSLIEMQTAAAKAGEPAYIGAKLNGLSDPLVIERLIQASMAGVRVELIVRGICCVTAGVERLTENITVKSVVGRFLEHSRIYVFGGATHTGRIVYISSADLMTRNTVRRVEAAVRIKDPEVSARLCEYFDAQFADTRNARVMQPDGSYLRAAGEKDSQLEFMTAAHANDLSANDVREERGQGNFAGDTSAAGGAESKFAESEKTTSEIDPPHEISEQDSAAYTEEIYGENVHEIPVGELGEASDETKIADAQNALAPPAVAGPPPKKSFWKRLLGLFRRM